MSGYTNAEVRDMVDEEGIGYAVTCYLSADSIADKKLAALWKDARKVLTEIQNILREAEDDEGDEDE